MNNVFLHGDLIEEVFMDLPLRCKHNGIVFQGKKLVYKLHKSIYGLKQVLGGKVIYVN